MLVAPGAGLLPSPGLDGAAFRLLVGSVVALPKSGPAAGVDFAHTGSAASSDSSASQFPPPSGSAAVAFAALGL